MTVYGKVVAQHSVAIASEGLAYSAAIKPPLPDGLPIARVACEICIDAGGLPNCRIAPLDEHGHGVNPVT